MSGQVLSLAEARETRARREARKAEQLVSKKGVAEHYGVSVRTIERWIAKAARQGIDLVATRLWGGSGQPRFHLSAWDEWHSTQRD